MNTLALFFSLFFIPLTYAGNPGQNADALNLHLIEQSKSNGFSIYRLGKPTREDIKDLCQKGIEEIMVLSGNAEQVEMAYQDACPNLKVVYNYKQTTQVALDIEFLNIFDEWVEQARITGKKIAFRCNCGCHRTGRLAAYYRMKFNGWDIEAAIDEMWKLGKWMAFFPHLKNQARALDDYIHGRPCSEELKHCVRLQGPIHI